MSSERKSQVFIDTRLDTWKSIAQYLNRSSRTVQRWHSEYGLPVHHLGGDASSVFAYTDELDRWLRMRDRTVIVNQLGSDKTAELVPQLESEKKQAQPIDPRDLEATSASEFEAAELVIKAQRLWESLSVSNLSTVARMYRKAIDLDASNPRAFAGLSQALIAQGVLGNLHPSAALHPAEAALKRALEIDPGLFEARCADAMLKIFLERDWSGAGKSLDELLLSHPTATQVLVGRAFFSIARSSLAEASELLRRASVERPLNSSVAELLCWVEYLSGGFESTLALIGDARDTGHSGIILDTVEAICRVLLDGPQSQIQRLEGATGCSPRNYSMLGVLGFAYGKVGQTTAARAVIDSMTYQGLAGMHDFAYPIALTYSGMGDHHEAIKWLEVSFRHGSLWGLGFPCDPMLAELRRDPMYQSFLGAQRYPQMNLHAESMEFNDFQRLPMPSIA